MLLSEQVVDSLHRIEGLKWNLHEYGIPVAHGAIPQSWKLEGLQFLAVLALRTYEACRAVNIIRKIETVALVVLCRAYQINRIEVGTIFEHLYIFLVGGINLAALQYLQANGAVLIICEERSSSRLADILHNSTNPHRAVELLAQVDDEVGILQFLNVGLAAAQVTLYETYDFLKLLVSVTARI